MWAYIFGNYIPQIEEAVRIYTATAYGNLLMLSLSGASTTIASSLLYSSKSILYVTKFTKLSPSRFLLENLTSSLIALLAISAVMFISVTGVFFARFGLVVMPVDAVGLFFGILLGALFIYALALFLNFSVIILRAPKSASFISFLPLILAFTAYASLWIDFGNVAYFSPFNCIVSVCYYYFSGHTPPTGNFLAQSERNLVNVSLVIVSLVAWSTILMVLNVVLLRKMRGVGEKKSERLKTKFKLRWTSG
ncbi:MAG: hypothetical protein ACQXXL_01405 [Candidatus Methanosuratincola sp.]|jgi:hypothetical protein|nr:hypothetical protein [Candidatus Methanosuratincola sp.]